MQLRRLAPSASRRSITRPTSDCASRVAAVRSSASASAGRSSALAGSPAGARPSPGLMSMKAIARSVSATRVDGMVPATIPQKRQFSLIAQAVPRRAGAGRGNGRYRPRLYTARAEPCPPRSPMPDELLRPTIGAGVDMSVRPWRLMSQTYVAFFGGVIALDDHRLPERPPPRRGCGQAPPDPAHRRRRPRGRDRRLQPAERRRRPHVRSPVSASAWWPSSAASPSSGSSARWTALSSSAAPTTARSGGRASRPRSAAPSPKP